MQRASLVGTPHRKRFKSRQTVEQIQQVSLGLASHKPYKFQRTVGPMYPILLLESQKSIPKNEPRKEPKKEATRFQASRETTAGGVKRLMNTLMRWTCSSFSLQKGGHMAHHMTQRESKADTKAVYNLIYLASMNLDRNRVSRQRRNHRFLHNLRSDHSGRSSKL